MASAKSEPSSDAEAPDQSHEELRYHHILVRLPNSSTLNGHDVIQQLKEDVEQAMAEDGAAHAQVTARTFFHGNPDEETFYQHAITLAFEDEAAAWRFPKSKLHLRIKAAFRPFLSKGGTMYEIPEAGPFPRRKTMGDQVSGFLESTAVYVASAAIVGTLLTSRL